MRRCNHFYYHKFLIKSELGSGGGWQPFRMSIKKTISKARNRNEKSILNEFLFILFFKSIFPVHIRGPRQHVIVYFSQMNWQIRETISFCVFNFQWNKNWGRTQYGNGLIGSQWNEFYFLLPLELEVVLRANEYENELYRLRSTKIWNSNTWQTIRWSI